MTICREAYTMLSNELMFIGLCKIPFKTCSCKTCSCGVSVLSLGESKRGGGSRSNNYLGTLFQCSTPQECSNEGCMGHTFFVVPGINTEVGFCLKLPSLVCPYNLFDAMDIDRAFHLRPKHSLFSKSNPTASWQDSVALLSCTLRQEKGGTVERGLKLPPINIGNETSICLLEREN